MRFTNREFWQGFMGLIEAGWGDCDRCPLACDRTNVVLGEGDVEATLFAIAEAPGEREDLTGRVLWGPSGSIFRQLSRRVDLDLQAHAFLTNTVACRPPKNRKPTREEREACEPRLQAQLQAIKPGVLLLMGKTALKMCEDVGRDPKLSDWRGKVPKENWPWNALKGGGATNLRLVYVTYHPSWALRQPTKQKKRMALRELQRDLAKIAPIVELIASRRAS